MKEKLKPETEADKLIREVAEFQIGIQEVERNFNKAVKQLRKESKRKIVPKQRAIKKRLISLFTLYQNNWKKFTQRGRRKIVNFVNGQIGSYMTPPAVNIQNKKRVLKDLEIHKLDLFIRVTKELDKEAILMHPVLVAGIKGIKVGQKEKFMVKPKETGTIVSEKVEKLKKILKQKS